MLKHKHSYPLYFTFLGLLACPAVMSVGLAEKLNCLAAVCAEVAAALFPSASKDNVSCDSRNVCANASEHVNKHTGQLLNNCLACSLNPAGKSHTLPHHKLKLTLLNTHTSHSPLPSAQDLHVNPLGKRILKMLKS